MNKNLQKTKDFSRNLSKFYSKNKKYGILLLSGVNHMGKNKKRQPFQISKEKMQQILSLLCIFFSFYILNTYLIYFSGISIQKNLSLWVSNTFFSMSWIFLLIGIIFSFQGILRRIVATAFVLLFSIITCLESLVFTMNGKYTTFNHLGFSISKFFESMSEELILSFFLSFLLLFVFCYFTKKIEKHKRDFYELSFFIFSIIFLFGLCRGIAYYSMGPQIIYTSGKKSEDLKTVYLEHKKAHLDFKISGLYDFTLKECYQNIQKQMKKTEEYLKK